MDLNKTIKYDFPFISIIWNTDLSSVDSIKLDKKEIKLNTIRNVFYSEDSLEKFLTSIDDLYSFFYSDQFEQVLQECYFEPQLSYHVLKTLSSKQFKETNPICLYFAFLATLIPHPGLQPNLSIFFSFNSMMNILSENLQKYIFKFNFEGLKIDNMSNYNNPVEQNEFNKFTFIDNNMIRDHLIYTALSKILKDDSILKNLQNLMFMEDTSDFIFSLFFSWIVTYSDSIIIPYFESHYFFPESIMNKSPKILTNLCSLFIHILSELPYSQMFFFYQKINKYFPYKNILEVDDEDPFYQICYLSYFSINYLQYLNIPKQIRQMIFPNERENGEANVEENVGENIGENVEENIWENVGENVEENEEEDEGFDISDIFDAFFNNLACVHIIKINFDPTDIKIILSLLSLLYPFSKQFYQFKTKWKVIIYNFINTLPNPFGMLKEESWFFDFQDVIKNEEEETNEEETNEEETNEEETNEEETNEEETYEAETYEAETYEAEIYEEETNEEETNEEETNEAETNEAETNEAETNEAETNEAETNEAETNESSENSKIQFVLASDKNYPFLSYLNAQDFLNSL